MNDLLIFLLCKIVGSYIQLCKKAKTYTYTPPEPREIILTFDEGDAKIEATKLAANYVQNKWGCEPYYNQGGIEFSRPINLSVEEVASDIRFHLRKLGLDIGKPRINENYASGNREQSDGDFAAPG